MTRTLNVLTVLIALVSATSLAQSQSRLASKTLRELNTYGITPSLDFSSDLFGVLKTGTVASTSQQWLDLGVAVDLARYHHALRRCGAIHLRAPDLSGIAFCGVLDGT